MTAVNLSVAILKFVNVQHSREVFFLVRCAKTETLTFIANPKVCCPAWIDFPTKNIESQELAVISFIHESNNPKLSFCKIKYHLPVMLANNPAF